MKIYKACKTISVCFILAGSMASVYAGEIRPQNQLSIAQTEATLPEMKTTKKSKKKKEAPRGPNSLHCARYGYDFSIDFLYWATNYNLPFFISGNKSETLSTLNSLLGLDQTVVDIKVINVKNNWSPGARVGFGFYPNYDNFDVQGYWTWYHNHSKKTSSMGGNLNNVVTSGSSSAVNNFLGGAASQASFHVTLNVGDLEIGRGFQPTPKVVIRPFAGVRAGWIDQDLDAKYFNITDSITITNGPNTGQQVTIDTPVKIRFDQDIWGVGPRIGMNSNWGSFYGFSMLGNISASLLYGKSHQKYLIDVITLDSNLINVDTMAQENETIVKIRDNFWQLYPTLQLMFGVSWMKCFDKTQRTLRLSAGWESNFWWDTSTILFFERSISFQGLNLNLTFEF